MTTQKCIKCLEVKILSEFHKNKDVALGVHSTCKTCKSIYRKNRYKENPKRELEVNEKWRLDNLELYKEYGTLYRREWRKNPENREKDKNTNKRWRKNNPGKLTARNAERKALKRKATPVWLTKEQKREINAIYELAKEIQWLSEEKLEIDHIVPLKGKNVCGLHVPWNLQILPASQNNKKKNNF